MGNNFINYKALITFGASLLKNHTVSNYKKESEWLLMHLTNKNYSSIIIDLNLIPTTKEIDDFIHLINLRCDHIPLQVIIGKASFYGRDFILFPDVFIPRPETEIIIDYLKKKPFQM